MKIKNKVVWDILEKKVHKKINKKYHNVKVCGTVWFNILIPVGYDIVNNIESFIESLK